MFLEAAAKALSASKKAKTMMKGLVWQKNKWVKSAAKSLADAAAEAKPPLPPPLLPPPAGTPLQPGEQVRICSDSAGRLSCGVEGQVCRVRMGKVQIHTAVMAVHEVPEAAVRRRSELKAPCQVRPLRQITALQREGWLVRAGWGEDSAGEDTFAGCAEHIEGVAPVMIGHQHVTLYWTYLQWALNLSSAPRPMKLLDPELVVAWYGGTTEAEVPATLQAQWRFILDTCTRDATAVVLIPLWRGEHWTLIVLDHVERQCRYYDSLTVESQGSYLVADFLVTELHKAGHASLEWLPPVCPHRRNFCRQGPLECGFFVCWWLEEECRAMMGEGWCSQGWPQPMEARRCLQRFMHNLKPAAEKIARDSTGPGCPGADGGGCGQGTRRGSKGRKGCRGSR